MGSSKGITQVLLAVAAGVLILFSAACQPSTQIAERELPPTSLPATPAVGHVLPEATLASATPTPSPTAEQPVESAESTLVLPATSLPPADPEAGGSVSTEPPPPMEAPLGDQLPIFVEMIQPPPLIASRGQMPPADASPTGLFAFDPSNRTLLVRSSVKILPTTEVLVGLMTAKVPNRPYVASDLYQFPSPHPAPLSVVAIDADTGTLTLAYAGQTFELRPGQSRSFKQKVTGELALIQTTTIINHSRPAAIGSLPADPGSR